MISYLRYIKAKLHAYQTRRRLLNEKLDQLTDPTFIERALNE